MIDRRGSSPSDGRRRVGRGRHRIRLGVRRRRRTPRPSEHESHDTLSPCQAERSNIPFPCPTLLPLCPLALRPRLLLRLEDPIREPVPPRRRGRLELGRRLDAGLVSPDGARGELLGAGRAGDVRARVGAFVRVMAEFQAFLRLVSGAPRAARGRVVLSRDPGGIEQDPTHLAAGVGSCAIRVELFRSANKHGVVTEQPRDRDFTEVSLISADEARHQADLDGINFEPGYDVLRVLATPLDYSQPLAACFYPSSNLISTICHPATTHDAIQ